MFAIANIFCDVQFSLSGDLQSKMAEIAPLHTLKGHFQRVREANRTNGRINLEMSFIPNEAKFVHWFAGYFFWPALFITISISDILRS